MLRLAARAEICCEQAVYGSFPFWDRGYDLLAASPGCKPSWLFELQSACQGYGERPRGAAGAGGLFVRRLNDGGWMIVGPSDSGADDRGRPGALAFHALFLTDREYRKADWNPFGLRGALRRSWESAPPTLPAIVWPLIPHDAVEPQQPDRVEAIVEALTQGRPVSLEASGPIDELAQQVWQRLPTRVRRNRSLATWVFDEGNQFDLVAGPRRLAMAGAPLTDQSLATAFKDAHSEPTAQKSPVRDGRMVRRFRPSTWIVLLGMGSLMAGIGMFLWSWTNRQTLEPPVQAHRSTSIHVPERSEYRAGSLSEDERQRVVWGLAELAERFGLESVQENSRPNDPVPWMVLLAEGLRYHGPSLSESDRNRLTNEPDGARALAWDDHLRRFAPDRPLPSEFSDGPLRWQLDTLAWSFGLEPNPRLSAAEVPHALARHLAIERTIRPHLLKNQYPELEAYEAFLKKLPRR